MPLACHLYPCREDNYGVLVHDHKSGQTAIIDVPDEMATREALAQTGWAPSHVFLTHHHDDHIDGVGGIRSTYDVKVVGNQADAHRLPRLDQAVRPGDAIMLAEYAFDILDMPGHTLGHIAYSCSAEKLAFVGDTLLALGCGRLFEGTAKQMYASLKQLAALDPDTLVYSGHEYTQANLAFALSVDPDNQDLKSRGEEINALRANGKATVPARLSDELATNPFLRAQSVEDFATLRSAKDTF